MESVGSASHFSATLYIMFSEGKPPSFSTFNFQFSITIICRATARQIIVYITFAFQICTFNNFIYLNPDLWYFFTMLILKKRGESDGLTGFYNEKPKIYEKKHLQPDSPAKGEKL